MFLICIFWEFSWTFFKCYDMLKEWHWRDVWWTFCPSWQLDGVAEGMVEQGDQTEGEGQAQVISSMDKTLPPVTCSIVAWALLQSPETLEARSPLLFRINRAREAGRWASGGDFGPQVSYYRSHLPLPSSTFFFPALSQQQIKIFFFFKLLRFRVRYTKLKYVCHCFKVSDLRDSA